MQPNPFLMGICLNNYGVACWKHRMESDQKSIEKEIETDFENTIGLFKKSIYNFENIGDF